MKNFNLKKLFLIHSTAALLLLIITFIVCLLSSINFGSMINTFKYAWLPSMPFMISSLVMMLLAIYRHNITFIIGLIQVALTLQTFETFLQLPHWQISFDIHSFVTMTFVAELTAIFNLVLLVTSSAGIYLMIKRYIDKRER